MSGSWRATLLRYLSLPVIKAFAASVVSRIFIGFFFEIVAAFAVALLTGANIGLQVWVIRLRVMPHRAAIDAGMVSKVSSAAHENALAF